MNAEELAAYVARVVAQAPPLDAAGRDFLVSVLRPTTGVMAA